jgi:hypothetical protein
MIAVLMSLMCTLCYLSNINGMESGAVITAATRAVGQLEWVVDAIITQEPQNVVLMLLVNAEHVGHEPCPEFGPLCCIAESLRGNIWGGDVGILDSLKGSCESGMKDSWMQIFSPLSERKKTQFRFDMDDMRNPVRTGYAFNSVQEVRVLTLVVEIWDGCDAGVDNKCAVRLKSYEESLKIDLSMAQRVSAVSVSDPCTSNKPANAFWLPSSDPAKCEWFCDKGFSQCPGFDAGFSEQICYLLPEKGATLRVKAAFTINLVPIGADLNAIASSLAHRFREAGLIEAEECAIIIRNEQNEISAMNRVDLPTVNGRIRVMSESHYDGVFLRDSVSTDKPNEAIPIELDDVDDRLLPGFYEITLLMYSNNTSFSLATQSVLLRYVLFDALLEIQGMGNILYVSEVYGVMRGLVYQEFSLTFFQLAIICSWGALLLALSFTSIFGDWRCISGTKTFEKTDHFDMPPSEWCGEHSPKDRVLLTILFIGIVSIIPMTVMFYLLLVLPSITSSGNVQNPFLMLGWLWAMVVSWILLTIVACFLAKCIRRTV